jgi:hypothetical protein
MRAHKTRLSVPPTRFVCSEDQLDAAAEPERVLVLPTMTFQKAVGLAQAKGFRAPRLQFRPSEMQGFARALKDALAEDVESLSRLRGSRRLTPLGQLREFFAQPAQARLLAKLLAFVEAGGTMNVTEG